MSHLIQAAVNQGEWIPFRVCRGYLFFADDFVLFAEATSDQVAVVQRILQEFCGASGHKEKVNVKKKKVLFLQCNVKPQLASLYC